MQLPFPDSSFTAVIDKGTLDALLPPSYDDDAKDTVERMFDEATRVLAVGGRHVIVSLVQEHIVRFYMRHFEDK